MRNEDEDDELEDDEDEDEDEDDDDEDEFSDDYDPEAPDPDEHRVACDSPWTEEQRMWGGRPVYDRNGCPANQRIDGGLEYTESVHSAHYDDDDD
ncbi:MAG: hypothetical protein H6718_04210 [Polyangiaceae bacterium]|nr:hypothetical protein [Polyangiaceae bacterium]